MTTEPIYKAVRKTLNSKPSFMALNQEFTPKDNADYYDSLFSYTETHKKIFEEKHTLSGIKDTTTNRLYFDFDSKNDLELARKDALTLITRLINEHKVPESNIAAYFSGQKGWAVELQLDKFISPEEFKAATFKLASDLTTFDVVINDPNRIVRLVNSRHQVSGLYKIQLHLWELDELSLNAILDLAKQPRATFSIKTTHLNSELFKVEVKKAVSVVVENEAVNGIRTPDNLDFNKCPKYKPRCIFFLEHGTALPGERSKLFFILARYYRNQGFSKTATYRLLKDVSEAGKGLYPESDKITKEEIWDQHCASAFSERGLAEMHTGTAGVSYDDELLEKYCDHISSTKKCILHGKKEKSNDVVKISDVSESFNSFAQDIDRNTIKTGIASIDDNMKILVGTSNLIVGSTGSGKTTLALNILENANKQGLNSMFFSLDMHKNLVFLKLAQKLTGYGQEEILSFYKNKDYDKIRQIREIISQKYNRTYFDFTTTHSYVEIQEKIQEVEEQIGEKIKLVVVDYASRLFSPFSDTFHSSSFNALKSVEVAEKSDVALLTICQVSRANSDGSTPLRTKRVAKDSGSWEESCRTQINVWRPFAGQGNNDKIFKVYVAKNTLGPEFETTLHWQGAQSIIRDLSNEEFAEYESELQPLEEQEAPKNKFSI